MPDQQPSFENVLEADMKALAAEIKSQSAKPEMRDASGKEVVKEALRAFPTLEKHPQAGGVPMPGAVSVTGTAKSPLPAYVADAPAEIKLEIDYLLQMAMTQGLGKALAESKKSSYFVQDALHDTLAGKLYPELQKRGVIK